MNDATRQALAADRSAMRRAQVARPIQTGPIQGIWDSAAAPIHGKSLSPLSEMFAASRLR